MAAGRGGRGGLRARPGAAVSSRAPSSRPRHAQPQNWDELATWWRATFTNGADVEYDQQILPLAVAHLAGCRRILDLGCGEGQLARRLAEGAGTAEAADAAQGADCAGAEGADVAQLAGVAGGSCSFRAAELVVGLDPFRRQLENAASQGGGASSFHSPLAPSTASSAAS